MACWKIDWGLFATHSSRPYPRSPLWCQRGLVPTSYQFATTSLVALVIHQAAVAGGRWTLVRRLASRGVLTTCP